MQRITKSPKAASSAEDTVTGQGKMQVTAPNLASSVASASESSWEPTAFPLADFRKQGNSSYTFFMKGVICTVKLGLPWPCSAAEVSPAEPAANLAPHLALRPTKAESSCQISSIFTADLKSLSLTFFSYSYTSLNFFLPYL